MSIWEMCKALYDKLITSAENPSFIDISLYAYNNNREAGQCTYQGGMSGIDKTGQLFQKVEVITGTVYSSFGTLATGSVAIIPEDASSANFYAGVTGWAPPGNQNAKIRLFFR